jgi:hypothetical protein
LAADFHDFEFDVSADLNGFTKFSDGFVVDRNVFGRRLSSRS